MVMALRHIGTCAVAFVLASCAGDNPENVPLYGEWQLVTKVDEFSVDGMSLPESNWPRQFHDLGKTETICGEPYFLEPKWQEFDIFRNASVECEFDRYDVTPQKVTARGVCPDAIPAANFSPKLSVDVSQNPERYRLFITMAGTATLPSGNGDRYLEVTAVQTGTRLGEC
ncbi:Protein of unknown function [Altererythrobacter xiamenensis]|uniref:Lipocalin-like domain-containing protein n=2 Tax=Altererythrobacter xiamenensis TaxID=1316679 RepID=A0A1Y6FEW9_9SPHN|nr:Protein of unknown function [Altererythrobacter xiamenensis]